MSKIFRNDKVRKWSSIAGVLAIIWMCIIFSFSAQTKEESSAVSEGLSYRMISTSGLFFHLHIDEEQLREIAYAIEHFVRKSAHMAEYGVLSVLFFLWLWRWEMPRFRRVWMAMAMAALYACSDEFHQLFVAGRAGRVSDILIDSAGAVLGLAFFLLVAEGVKAFCRRRRARKERKID